MSLRFVSAEAGLDSPALNTLESSPHAGAITDALAHELGDGAHKWLRRLVIGGATLAVAGVAADLQLTRHYFNEAQIAAEAGIHPLDPAESETSKKQRLVVVPGYTNRNPYTLVSPKKLQDTFGEDYDIWGLHFDPNHDNQLTTQYFTDFFAEDSRPISALALSMGGAFLVGALARAVELGVEVPPLENLILHCSPYDYKGIHPAQRRVVRSIAAVEKFTSHYPGGLLAWKGPIRALNGALVRQIVDPETGEVSAAGIARSFIYGARISTQDGPPKQCGKQAAMWHGNDVHWALETLHRAKVLNEKTRVLFVRPAKATDDKIVRVNFAQGQWGGGLEGKVGWFGVREAGLRHVDPSALDSDMLDPKMYL